jgi:hypothetical protein
MFVKAKFLGRGRRKQGTRGVSRADVDLAEDGGWETDDGLEEGCGGDADRRSEHESDCETDQGSESKSNRGSPDCGANKKRNPVDSLPNVELGEYRCCDFDLIAEETSPIEAGFVLYSTFGDGLHPTTFRNGGDEDTEDEEPYLGGHWTGSGWSHTPSLVTHVYEHLSLSENSPPVPRKIDCSRFII